MPRILRQMAVLLGVAGVLAWFPPSANCVGKDEAPGAAPVSVSASIDPATATVGDRLKLTVRVERDEGAVVTFPDVAREVEPLKVLDSVIVAPSNENGRVVEDRIYILAAFETGDITVPALEFSCVSAAGDSGTVATDTLRLTIASVLPEGADESETEPRDIKPPVNLPRRVWPYFLVAAIVAAALAAVLYLRRFLRRLRKPERVDAIPPRVPRRAAHIVAFERLSELERDDPIGRGEIIPFYVRVTEILRLYIRDRFAVDAIDMTTAELVPSMISARIDPGEVEWTSRFLCRADLSKFAKHMPAADQGRDDFRAAWEFVERTRLSGDDTVAESGTGTEEAEA